MKGNVSSLKRLVFQYIMYYIARATNRKNETWKKLLFKYSIEQLDMN